MTDTAATPKVQEIILAGRKFVPCTDTTIEQDQMISSILHEAGLDRLKDFNPAQDNFGEFGKELIIRAFNTGKLFALLGAMLEEPGVEFSMEGAAERTEFLRRLKRPVDKDALKGSIVALILSFFVSGAFFRNRFGRYSFRAATDTSDPTNPRHFVEVLDTITESGTMS